MNKEVEEIITEIQKQLPDVNGDQLAEIYKVITGNSSVFYLGNGIFAVDEDR